MANPRRPPSNPSAKTPPAPRYVSRGGLKLRGALDDFGADVAGKTCLDVGSSTGGFTDCLLQAGARSVWCVDVGYGLLDYNLRKDPRVRVLERTNFRLLDPALLDSERPSITTIDVSFISLGKILPKVFELLPADGQVIALIKPQFEGTPKEAPGGFVKDEAVRRRILERVRALIEAAGFKIRSVSDSKVKGRKGNQETFFYLFK